MVIKMLEAVSLWFFRAITAHTEPEFLDLVGNHRALDVLIYFDRNKQRDSGDLLAFNMVCKARGPKSLVITHQALAGYMPKVSWESMNKHAVTRLQEWDIEHAQRIAHALYARYLGITVKTADNDGEKVINPVALHRRRQLTLA
jgi:hypothetical protein